MEAEAVPFAIGWCAVEELVNVLFKGDVVRDHNKGDGGQHMLEALEGEEWWVGSGVEQGSDAGNLEPQYETWFQQLLMALRTIVRTKWG